MTVRIRFFSQLNAPQIISLCFLSRTYDELYYFNISKIAKALLILLNLHQRVKLFGFKMCEIKDELGGSYRPKINEALINATDVIKDEVLKRDSFVRSFGKLFESERVISFFRKIVFKEIEDIIIFMNVISWYRQKSENGFFDIDFSIYRTPFFNTLKDIALREYKINLVATTSISRSFKHLYMIFGNLYLSMVECFFSIVNSFNKQNKKTNINGMPLLGNAYTGGGLTFDLIQRCDFPWLLVSDMPSKQILIHFNKKYKPTIQDLSNIVNKQHDFNFLATFEDKTISKFMPIYKPTARLTKMLFGFGVKVFLLMSKEILSGNINSIYYMDKVIHFIRVYSKAYNFYCDNNIKINIDRSTWDPYLAAEQIALWDSGGVSIGVQAAALRIPDTEIVSSYDIMFLFSPYYFETFVKSETYNDTIIFYGYFTDYSFRTVSGNSKKLRDKLKAAGAKFIICYFDENSSDDRMRDIPHSRSAYIYRRLLKWVVSDETIGLICNPKNPATLHANLPEITELIKKAVDTGRCVFMEGERRTYNYPTEAAQAADIVIGLLIGGTAALECYLSGCRVVYLDLEHLYSFPEYKWGRNIIVFDDLDVLLAAINNYRSNRELYDDLGNVKVIPDINIRDSFRDGKAAERIASYICWLLESFDKGMKRNEAIQYANEQYIKRWGEDKLRTETGKTGRLLSCGF